MYSQNNWREIDPLSVVSALHTVLDGTKFLAWRPGHEFVDVYLLLISYFRAQCIRSLLIAVTKYSWETVKGRGGYFCSNFKGIVHHGGEGRTCLLLGDHMARPPHILVGQDTEEVECWLLSFLGDPVSLTTKMNRHSWLEWTFIFFAKPYCPILEFCTRKSGFRSSALLLSLTYNIGVGWGLEVLY